MTEVAALEARVTRLEDQISTGFDRIEMLLRQEISDLKKEQIDDLKKANERLADDQRRMWDRVVDMERRENRRVGDHSGERRAWSAVGHFMSAAAGATITWLFTWMSGGKPPLH